MHGLPDRSRRSHLAAHGGGTVTGWHEGPMLALDFESTGVDPLTSRPVQVALARIVPGKGADEQVWLVDADVAIPDGAAAVHGITTEQVRADGEPAADVMGEVFDAVVTWLEQGLPLVAFNAAYDCTLLESELVRHGLPTVTGTLGGFAPVIDPRVLDKQVSRRRGKRTLSACCEHYQVPIGGAHNAGHDALATARVAWRIAQRYPAIAVRPLPELHEAQVGWAREQADSLRAYFDGKGIEHDGCDSAWPVRQAAVSA